MCVTKINKHSPPSLDLPLKRRLCKPAFRASVPFCPLPPPSCLHSFLARTGNWHPPPRQEAVLSQRARKAKVISIVEAVFTFWVCILIFSSQASGQGSNAQIAWGQSAGRLGLGRPFHTQRHAPKKPPATKKGKWGELLLIQDHGFQEWFQNISHWSFWESRMGVYQPTALVDHAWAHRSTSKFHLTGINWHFGWVAADSALIKSVPITRLQLGCVMKLYYIQTRFLKDLNFKSPSQKIWTL